MNDVDRGPLRVRWLGRVPYGDALTLQHALFRRGGEDHLLLLEHDHVYTLGVRARLEHVLDPPETVGATLVRADRGGDVTYHGPGQLVGYPILDLPMAPGSVPDHVHRIEELVIGALADLGLEGVGTLAGYPGVWVDPGGAARKICAIGVRVSRGRTMHGFALNVAPDLSMFAHIVPCGIVDRPVTSLRAEGIDVGLPEVLDAVVGRAGECLFPGQHRRVERQDETPPGSARRSTASAPLLRRLEAAGVEPAAARPLVDRKPAHLRVRANMGEEYLQLRRTMRRLDLVTVCEEAGCPNIYECWAEGTATFMINGERCTRACGFCLVDTGRPAPPDPGEPEHVAEAAAAMGLRHVVVTAVARDDLDDGGASGFAATTAAIRRRLPGASVELLIPDCKGDEAALSTIFSARPDVLNHNLETVLRLQRAIRPSASYARSLAVLARARAAGLRTKSGLVLGMGEENDEVLGALADLRGVGVDVVTLGQYLRPSAAQLPVARYLEPSEFAELAAAARKLGFAHVEASPLTRSSYHAARAVPAVAAEGLPA